jgi:steroid delta-isomerase-like uncharacterized protein
MPDTPPNITIDSIISAWNSHDPNRLAAFFTPDAVYEEVPFGSSVQGQAALSAMFASIFTAFPDLVMTAGRRVEQTDCLVWEWIITGTHRGPFMEIPATENSIQLRGVSFCSLRAGKVAQDREYWDMAALKQQLNR